MDKNPPTKFKDAVILHLANNYKSAKINYIETGRKKITIRYSEIRNRKPFNTLLCTLRAVVSPGWTLRCEGRETSASNRLHL